jgi:hypothetical protein
MARLRALAGDYRLLVLQASSLRGLRDALALELVDEGATWREVAEAAGFEDAELGRKRRLAGAFARQSREDAVDYIRRAWPSRNLYPQTRPWLRRAVARAREDS